ncbi:transposase [Streptomyces scopuliridis]|uniref:transposase n=1 Tax=Streptomyces scopuliridis TaxID=452529 RepID=UPI00369976EE
MYSPEFRADAVALYHSSPGGTYASVAKDLGVNHETLRTWVRDAEQAALPGAVEATGCRLLRHAPHPRCQQRTLSRSTAAFTRPVKSGWGWVGRERSSGWAWVATR